MRARESLLTIPVVLVVAAVLLAIAALYLDSTFEEGLDSLPIVLGTTVAGGRAIATTVAGATITVAAIVFSITALSTQMAANQYSPRALGGFFEDPFQQVIIGLVVGTFTYSLLILASLSNAIIDGSDPSPSLSVTIAIVLGVASAIGIVAYINHSLRRMQIDSVVRRIAAGSIRAIERHLSEKDTGSVAEGPPPHGESVHIEANTSGWVIGLDTARILATMPPGSIVRVDVRLGEAVSKGDRLIAMWPDPGDEWEGKSTMAKGVITAPERSLEHDPTFGIRQLVDIALRALSPGVNDPTTAVDVIHHLKTPVRKVLLSDAPRRVFTGPDDRRLFLAAIPGRSDYVHFAFSEIRLAATHQPYVLSALIEVLQDIKDDLRDAGLEAREPAVDSELELIAAAARSSGLPEPDLERALSGLREEKETTQ